MPKQTLSGPTARAALQAGVDFVANPVRVTLGPRGRNVLLDRPGQPLATRDGVTVAKEVSFLADPFANMGAAYAREVADAAVHDAGDGTTTATVLLQAIVRGGIRLINSGAEPILLADGIQHAAGLAARYIAGLSIRATPGLVEQAAIISTHGDKDLGALIAAATLEVGENGQIELYESRTHETHFRKENGFYFERGWFPDPVWVNSADGRRCVLDDPYILISERMIVGGTAKLQGDHIFNLVGQCVQARRPLLIIADNLIGDAYNLVTANMKAGPLPGACFVMLPGFGPTRADALRDLAAATGCRRIHTKASTHADDVLSSFTLDDLGQCKQAVVSPDRTVLLDGAGTKDAVMARCKQLIEQSAQAENPFDKAQLDLRVARLIGGVGSLYVGDRSEPAMLEKKARAEDAIHACRAALQQGLVPGGGVALLRASAWLQEHPGRAVLEPEQRLGYDLLATAMQAPAVQIARNAGHRDSHGMRRFSPRRRPTCFDIVEKVLAERGAVGYDAAAGEIRDMLAAGIVDPAKVVQVALGKAASIGALLLTTEALVAELPSAVPPPQNPPGFRVR